MEQKQQLAVPTCFSLPPLLAAFSETLQFLWGSEPTPPLTPHVGGDQLAVSWALKGAHPSSTSEMCAIRVLLSDGFENN